MWSRLFNVFFVQSADTRTKRFYIFTQTHKLSRRRHWSLYPRIVYGRRASVITQRAVRAPACRCQLPRLYRKRSWTWVGHHHPRYISRSRCCFTVSLSRSRIRLPASLSQPHSLSRLWSSTCYIILSFTILCHSFHSRLYMHCFTNPSHRTILFFFFETVSTDYHPDSARPDLTTRRYTSVVYAVVCLLHAGNVSKRLNLGSRRRQQIEGL